MIDEKNKKKTIRQPEIGAIRIKKAHFRNSTQSATDNTSHRMIICLEGLALIRLGNGQNLMIRRTLRSAYDCSRKGDTKIEKENDWHGLQRLPIIRN